MLRKLPQENELLTNVLILVEKAFDEYISKGGKKDLKDFEDTLDNYLIQGYCGY